MIRLTRGTLLWTLGYAAMMAAIVGLLWSARGSVLALMDDSQQRVRWQEWKHQEEARALEDRSPVERRPPVSDEPPTLVLMRDHFGAVVVTCLAAASVLFGFLALVIRGMLAGSKTAASGETKSGCQTPLPTSAPR
jgi:hypothetical protein